MINVFNKQQLQKEIPVGGKKRSNEANDVDEDDMGKTKKEKKKHKKEKVKHGEEEEEQEAYPVDALAEVSDVDVAGEDVDDEAAARRERKRRKKEAKKQKKLLSQQENNEDKDIDTQEVRVLKAMDDSSSTSNDYISHAGVVAMTPVDVASFRSETQISLLPEEEGLRYKPLTSFSFLEPSLAPYSNLKG